MNEENFKGILRKVIHEAFGHEDTYYGSAVYLLLDSFNADEWKRILDQIYNGIETELCFDKTCLRVTT